MSMGRITRRVVEIYRTQGLRTLFIAILDHVAEAGISLYWNLRGGTQRLSVAGVTAEFEASTQYGGDQVRWGVKHEREMLVDFLENVQADDVVYDVGANVGVYTCFASRKVNDGTVVAFEPYPPNIEPLERNIGLNNGRGQVLDVALSNTAGTVEFGSPRSHDAGGATASMTRSAGTEGFSATTERGDELIDKGTIPQPTVVKIDVEGAEPLVIDGLRAALLNDECRLLYCEVHKPSERRPSIDDFGATYEEFCEELRALGFALEVLVERPFEVHLKGTKRADDS